MMRPRLLHITTTDVSLDWLLGPQLDAFRQAGYEVFTASAPGNHVEALRDRGIEHMPIHSFTRRVDPVADVRAVAELYRTLRQVRPNILHTHNPKPGVIGRLIGHRAGVPIVVNTVHGLYSQPHDPWGRRLAVYAAEAWAARGGDVELAQNEEDMPILRRLGVDPGHLVHLGNGIDLQRFQRDLSTRARSSALRSALGIDSASIVVGMVGRLVWEKGYAELIDAIEILRATSSRTFEFVVVGPREPGKAGAVDDESIQRMRSLGVHVLDPRADLENVYPAFDLFVLPSHREGFPRAAMEATAMGVPVIATNIRGCRQVVEDGVTGRLVEPRRPAALAAAIEQLGSSASTRSRMAKAGVRIAEARFDQNRVIGLTLEVYRRLLRLHRLPLPTPRVSVDQSVEPVLDVDATNDRYVDSISLVDEAASNFDADSFAA
ncbi:MAG: glycosyltransferase family 4 protein [Acidimicrobiales bacterium]